MKWFLCIAFSMILMGANAQTRIEGEILSPPDDHILLAEHFGENIKVIDTIPLDKDNCFVYHLSPNKPKGLYRLLFSKNIWLDFILGWENLKFQTIADDPVESLDIQKSWQNKKLYEFIALLEKQNQKVDVLRDFISNYPDVDKLLKLSKKEANRLYQNRQAFLDELRKEHPDAFVTSYLTFLFEWPQEMYYSNNAEVKHRMISNRDWSDTLLLNSDAYSTALIDYLMLYGNRDAGREQQISLYKQAVDSVFNFIPEHTPVYDYAMLYLMEGFEQFRMEPLVIHMIENYADNCNRTEGNLNNRIDYYESFQKGATAPDFITTTLDGEPVNFYQEVSGKTLLVFWATWCGHCKELNQSLAEIYPQLEQKGIEVISVSLDHNPDALNEYLENYDLPFEVWCDYNGWKSDVVDQYHLYATPTMLLLDKDKTIIGKPLNLNQIVYMINDVQ